MLPFLCIQGWLGSLALSKSEAEASATAGAPPSLLLVIWGVKYDS
jgi:hypothetical protein